MMIQWTPDLATGFDLVDAQHKELFNRVRALVEAVDNDDLPQVEEMVDFLTDYVIEHFGTEEKIMLRLGCENFEAHRDEHTAFIKGIYSARRDIETRGITEQFMNQLVAEVIDWLVNHIHVRDKTVKAFLSLHNAS